MSLQTIRRWLCWALLGLAVGTFVLRPLDSLAQEDLTRKIKSKVVPVYPDIARKMNISGTVKVIVVVAPNGDLKSTRVVGGHPLLVNAAMDALKKWKFVSAPGESTGVIEFKFRPPE